MANEAARRAAAEQAIGGRMLSKPNWKEIGALRQVAIDLQLDLDDALALVAEYRVALGQITIADDKSAGVYEHMLAIDPKMLEGK